MGLVFNNRGTKLAQTQKDISQPVTPSELTPHNREFLQKLGFTVEVKTNAVPNSKRKR